MSALRVAHSNATDNQRFMPLPLRDGEPERGGLLPGEEDTKVKAYYKNQLADRYQVSIESFNRYYLHCPAVYERLVGLGYHKTKTRLLSHGMVKVLFEVHGKP